MGKWMILATNKPKVTNLIKSNLDEAAGNLIDQVLKPKIVKAPVPEGSFNYLVGIFTKWYGNSFYFCSKYNSPGENAISPSFEMKFARMAYIGNEKFNLSYMRHNDKWFELYKNLTINECLNAIEHEPYFEP